MGIPDELRNIRDHLRSGRFGQREVWEQQLENAAVEIERLKAVADQIQAQLEREEARAYKAEHRVHTLEGMLGEMNVAVPK